MLAYATMLRVLFFSMTVCVNKVTAGFIFTQSLQK